MEESKPSVIPSADSSAPPSTTTTQTSPHTTPTYTNPSAASNAFTTTTTKKRTLESDNGGPHSNYFKIRAIVRDLRPHFIEVLRTPDFKNSKASQEIREQLKVMVKLYENMKADAASLGKSKQDSHPYMDQRTQQEQKPQHVKSLEQIQVEKSFAKQQAPGLQKMQADDGQGTYVVGGSAFGWNFIIFSGKDAVYYGRTKEEFRSAQVTK